MVKAIINFFKLPTEQQLASNYLANSASLQDLERRQRELDMGLAPFQQKKFQMKDWM